MESVTDLRMTSDEAPLRRGGGMKYASQALPRRRLLLADRVASWRRGFFMPLALPFMGLLLINLSFAGDTERVLPRRPISKIVLPVDTLKASTLLADSSFTIPKPGDLPPGVGRLTVLVVEPKTLYGLPGCEIRLKGHDKTYVFYTDFDGHFTLPKIVPGSYPVQIWMIGYRSVMVPDVPIRPDQETHLVIKLKNIPIHKSKNKEIVTTP